MRHCLQIAAVITTIAVFEGSARAGVSDDLVFCSKLSNSKERIACYDAAARIAANSGAPARHNPSDLVTARAASIPTAPYTAAPEAAPPRFQGGYLAVGGAYGLGGTVPFSVFDQIQGFSGFAQPEGPSIIAAAGYNLQVGNLVTGVELSGRFGAERFSASNFNISNSPLGVIGASTVTATFNVDASVHAALRAGLAIGDTLAFVKAGAGVAHFVQGAHSAQTGTICDAFGFNGFTSICTNRSPLTPFSADTTAWRPSLLLGLGLEHNFGPVFVRGETEAEAVSRNASTQQSDWLWTIRALAAIGVRF